MLVQINFNSLGEKRDELEFKELVHSAGADARGFIIGNRSAPDSKLFVGKGKAEEIRLVVKNTEPDVVIFDHDLSPAQERNLEQVLECRVMDRTGLILDIFAQRARSHEGKLQRACRPKQMRRRLSLETAQGDKISPAHLPGSD